MIICYLPPIKGTRKLHWYYKQIRYLYVPRFMINTLPASALGRVKWCKDHRESSCIYHDNIIYIYIVYIYFSWIDDGHVDATIAMGVFRYAIHVQSSANAWKIHLYPSGVWYQVPWLFGPHRPLRITFVEELTPSSPTKGAGASKLQGSMNSYMGTLVIW